MSYKQLLFARFLMQMSVEEMAKHIEIIRAKSEKNADKLVNQIIALCNLRGENNGL